MLFSLIEGLEKIDIILASASPRRFQLLKSLGLNFRVEKSNAEEIEWADDPAATVEENALQKGLAVARKYPKDLIVSADTIVVLDNMILGKPKNEQDAIRMLQALNGKTHQVYTAFGLFYQKYNLKSIDNVSTNVTFRDLTEEEILAYVGTAESMDKAGAYAIQGQGAILIKSINGCYFNVVGFPLAQFYLRLTEFFKEFVI